MINVPDKDCASLVIHEGFDLIPDMGRSIDSRIFVMCHATFDFADFLTHRGPNLSYNSLFPPPLCLPLLSRRVNELMGGCPIMEDGLQNRVMLEKLKSRSVIAGTRSLPVSDVIASVGVVKAAIRLKTRRGLS